MPAPSSRPSASTLLDATRRLTPEEMAELQLEQGYVQRALRIYDELTAQDPANAHYATRRAWLARLAAVRPIRLLGVSSPDERSPKLLAAVPRPRARERTGTDEGVGPLVHRAGNVEPTMAGVRALRIVGVR